MCTSPKLVSAVGTLDVERISDNMNLARSCQIFMGSIFQRKIFNPSWGVCQGQQLPSIYLMAGILVCRGCTPPACSDESSRLASCQAVQAVPYPAG